MEIRFLKIEFNGICYFLFFYYVEEIWELKNVFKKLIKNNLLKYVYIIL